MIITRTTLKLLMQRGRILIVRGIHTKNQPENPVIEKIKARLATRRKEFEKQMKEVKKKYPLVALAFYLHEAAVIDSATHTFSKAVSVSVQSVLISQAAQQIDVRLRACRRKFEREAGRAKTDEETVNAISNWAACFLRK